MPVVAVAGAIYAGSTIATVGIAAMTTMQVVSAVGAIASGIGAITGNKSLMQIGGVASLAGGIGSFAQGKGWLSGDSAFSGAEGVSNTTKAIAAPAPGVVDPSANLATNPSSASYTNQMDMASDAAAGGNAASPVAGAVAPTGLVNQPASLSVAEKTAASSAVAQPAAATSTSSSIFGALKEVGSFMKDNKEIASMGLNFVGGLFDEKKEAEAEMYSARADEIRRQGANASAVPDLTGLKLNPAVKVFNTAPPPVYQAPRPGLINATGR